MRRLLCCAVLLVVAGTVMTMMTGTAVAQTAKEPVIDSAPERLRYRGSGTLVGHLEGWVAGDEVGLQRRYGESWKLLRSRVVDDDGTVRFRLLEMKTTRVFRLVHVDAASGTETVSDSVRVRVGSRLTLRLSTGHVMRGRAVTASGRLASKGPSRSVAIQQRVRGSWRSMGTAYVRDGRFALRFEANHLGFHRVRAVFRGDARNLRSQDKEPMRVYGPARATWYGPGLYGNRTACGQTLARGTVGVAHRWLPCGTKVGVLYRGRTIVVPVIDRGPYANHADWDLTQEAAERVGMYSTATVGVDPGA